LLVDNFLYVDLDFSAGIIRHMNQKRVIGLSGVARAGKDTFAAILEKKLVEKGNTIKKIALADPLKKHCDPFLTERLGISAFTQVPEEKILIRPFLVWYGDAQRKRTHGRYWIEQANVTIEANDADYFIVTDVRYDAYEKDEIYWLQQERKGVVCHVSRFTPEPTGRVFVEPANEHERINNPKVKAKADFVVEWESVKGLTMEEILNAPSLNAHVDEFIAKFNL
jgi:hypothetical protein